MMNFGEVIKMVDDMVAILGKDQADDEKQKAYCEGEFEKAADEEAAAKTKLAQTDATLAELTDSIGTLMEEISALEASIAALDKEVADADERGCDGTCREGQKPYAKVLQPDSVQGPSKDRDEHGGKDHAGRQLRAGPHARQRRTSSSTRDAIWSSPEERKKCWCHWHDGHDHQGPRQ